MLQHAFVSLERSGNEYSLTVYDVNTSDPDRFTRKKFTYSSEVEASQAELNVIGDAVYIAPHNKVLYLREGVWYLEDFISTFPSVEAVELSLSETLEVSTIGTLKPQENFYYTARYRYQDGHVTQVGYPVFVNTGVRVYNVIDIPLQQDGDRFADVELFRKEGAGEFQFLERFRSPLPTSGATLRYVDYGKLTSSSLVNRVSVWNKSHQTQAVVRDRYVRANVTFPDLTPQIKATATSKSTDIEVDNEGLPYNSVLQLFSKVRFEDAQESYFVPVGQFTINEESELRATLTSSNGKEVAFYGKYTNQQDFEDIFFGSQEIYNLKVPSLETIRKPEAEQDRPVNPHVFLGYRYVQARREGLSQTTWRVTTESLEFLRREITGRQIAPSIFRFFPSFDSDVGTITTALPQRIYIEAGKIVPRFSLTPTFGAIPYVLKYQEKEDISDNLRVVYEMEFFEGLNEAANQGKIFIKSTLTSSVVNSDQQGPSPRPIVQSLPNYSTQLPNSQFVNLTVQVVGVTDKSGTEDFIADTAIVQPPKSSVYLQLDPDSAFGKFDYLNPEYGTNVLQSNLTLEKTPAFPFSLLNLVLTEGEVSDDLQTTTMSTPPGGQTKSVPTFVWSSLLKYKKNVDPNVPPVYLGKFNSPGSKTLRTGYVKRRVNGFEYFELPEYNIYETLVTEGDIGQFKTVFPNQIVWSDTFIEGTNVSGIRNFKPESFLNISTENGPILKLEYVRNNLLVFCSNGLAVVTIGEVLTQGTENQVRVDSSRFLNSEVWVLKDSPTIDKRSIKRTEDMIFFADTNDVWAYTDSIENISKGAVPIKGGVGLIDPVNKEYQITSGGLTWAYNYEVNEWAGPFTYRNGVNTFVEDRVISAVDGRLSDHNFGNDFNGKPYETVIESVAEDLQDASTDKLYRKFYVQHEGEGEFSYTKDNDYYGRDLSEYRTTGETKQIGVKSLGAAKKLYWRIKTFKEFILKLVAFEYTPRNRR
jgi:hypothetical protein